MNGKVLGSIPDGAEFSSLPNFQIGPCVRSAFYQINTGLFLAVKRRSVRGAHFIAEVMKVWNFISLLPSDFITCKGATFILLFFNLDRFHYGHFHLLPKYWSDNNLDSVGIINLSFHNFVVQNK